jgi:peptidase E
LDLFGDQYREHVRKKVKIRCYENAKHNFYEYQSYKLNFVPPAEKTPISSDPYHNSYAQMLKNQQMAMKYLSGGKSPQARQTLEHTNRTQIVITSLAS